MSDTIQLQNPGGFTINLASTDEPPMVLPRCACNGRPAFDRVEGDPAGVRPDPNYGDNDPATGYGLSPDEREQAAMEREQRMRLGLEPFPGAPAKSFG